MEPEKSKEALKEFRAFMAEIYTWEPQEQITYLTTALEASQTLQDDSSKFYFAEKLGVLYRELDSMEWAYTLLTDALRYSYDPSTKRIALNSMGGLHLKISDFSGALDYYFQSVEEAKKLNDGSEAYPLGNISEIYANMEDYDNAIKYLRYSISFSEKLKSPEKSYSLVYDYSYMTQYFGAQNNIDSARKYIASSLSQIKQIETLKKQKYQDACFMGYLAISEFYLSQKKPDQARFYIQKTQDFAHPFYQASVELLRAEYHMLTGAYEKALGILENSKVMDQEYSGREGLMKLQAACYSQLGDFEKAAHLTEQILVLKQETFNQDRIKFVAFADAKYENIKKTEEIKSLRLNQEVQALTIQNQRFVVLIISLIVLLLAAGGVLLWRRYRNRHKMNIYLQELVAIKTSDLQKANEELRILNYVASHDLKEPINNIQSYTQLIQHKLPAGSRSTFHPYFSIIHSSIKQVYTLVEDLARYLALANTSAVETSEVNLNTLVSDIQSSLDTFIDRQNGRVVNHGLPTLQTNSAMVQVILNNLIENGLKFNHSKPPTVELSHSPSPQGHQLLVSDNGIGIEKEFHQSIFESCKRLHNRSDYVGSGMGLTIVKVLVEKLGGSISIESNGSTGSTFVIQLPG